MSVGADIERPSAGLFHLAALIGAHLSGKPVPPARLDHDGVRFAQRQGVGLLVLAAARESLDPSVVAELENYRRLVKLRQAVEGLNLTALGGRLARAGIPWLVLKGAPQARLLYGDPALRPSSDIDILVPPAHFSAAIAELRAMGWKFGKAHRKAIIPQCIALRMMRDVSLYAPGAIPMMIELHQRVMFGERVGLTTSALFSAVEHSPFPAPGFGPDLAYYVFAHGALSSWPRLKWLVDLAQVLTKLDEAGSRAVLSRAKALHTTDSLVASVSLTTELFQHTAASLLGQWAAEHRDQPAVRKRRSVYWSTLLGAEAASLPNKRLGSLRTTFLFHQSPLTRCRMLVQAPAATLLRIAAGLSH